MTELALSFAIPAVAAHRCGSGVGGAPAWTPASLGSALRVWLKADVGITLNTTKVAAWADQSGNAIHFTQVTGAVQPTYLATGFNSLPTVEFVVATNNCLESAIDSAFNLGTTMSFFVVAQMHSPTTNYGRFLSYISAAASNTGTVIDWNNANAMAVLLRNSTNDSFLSQVNSAVTTAQAISLATNYRLGLIFDGVNVTPYVNNAAGTTTAIAPNMSGGNGMLRIGADARIDNNAWIGAGVGWWDGYLSELVIVNTALSSGDRLELDNYFKAKWGLS